MDTAESIEESESPEVIRERIEETRAALGQKLETLETEVRTSVQEASETVKETVNNVKKVFDMKYQVQTRPWMALGAAFGVGLALGTLAYNQPWGGQHGTETDWRRVRTRRAGSSATGRIKQRLQPEFDTVKSIAIGAAMTFLGDLLRDALPHRYRSRVDPIVASATEKLGGERPPGSMRRDGEYRARSAESYGSEGYATGERDDLPRHDGRGFTV